MVKPIVYANDITAFDIEINRKKIYWADGKSIKSVTYDGGNRTAVVNTSKLITSLATLDNKLYWLEKVNVYSKVSIFNSCTLTNKGVCGQFETYHQIDRAVEIKAYDFDRFNSDIGNNS